jgi:ATP-dependent Lhr-like helicase
MYAEDLLQSVFPDAAACLDNLQGAREVPEHPLVQQALRDSLEEAMDLPGLLHQLRRLFSGELKLLARDTPEPSVLCHEILNSQVYTFLDDAPLEERRARAVYTRRATEVRSADDLGALDPAAIQRVREEAWPVANTADELYDALMVAGYLLDEEITPRWRELLGEVSHRTVKMDGRWYAMERKDDPAEELQASRMEVLGPIAEKENSILLTLEGQGRILRGRFTPGTSELEWCDRRLLARIHRYTLNRLRSEIEPVSAADFMRFLLHWQHLAVGEQLKGAEGLAAIVEQLEGFELAAAAWEHDVLPARVSDYGAEQIDRLCLSGRVAWGRLTPGDGKVPLRSSPIALMLRQHVLPAGESAAPVSAQARSVRAALENRGALFFNELVAATSLLPTLVERGLAELVSAGLVTADSFSGLRALLAPQHKRNGLVQGAGRWALFPLPNFSDVEVLARGLLKRYGVVFRALLQRESLPPWRDLVRVYRRLEARGEIRGGRFVAGFGGEQFAAADAVGKLRAVRKLEKGDELVALSGADPLNLVGILTPGARVPALAGNRVLLRDGVAIAAVEGGKLRRLAESELSDDTLHALARRFHWRSLDPYLRSATPPRPGALERTRDRLMNLPWSQARR